ncbi:MULTISPECIES: DUF2057 domain-containing protein [Pseudomonadati]|uniref:DUF2057 domain-containing protein n=1 Tax=Shewanella aestuarii TaxID=1028752 RepID=A0ABT0L3A5_9GAMM|nr:DUF2057 domain-containing protein [Shewanella aestuarii]MCL1118187.1 DUF2057 domain-containing protein [Shewanella aestuarii]GGN81420.1 UPF0319 protein [Shewanella aestuarii]
MKSFVTTGAIMALLSSTSLMAANLTIPMSFEYLALDGKQIETNMFSHKSDLKLDNGSHKIAIRYHDMVEDDFSDSQSFIKSAPFIVTLNVVGDVNYTLSAADGEVIKRPKSFAKDPKVIITREDKGSVNYSVEQTNFEEESFLANIFNGNKGNDVDALSVNATSNGVAPAAVVQSATPPASATVAATAVATTVATTETKTAQPIKADNPAQAEQMLQYWWLQADEKTRKEFMGWAIKQL